MSADPGYLTEHGREIHAAAERIAPYVRRTPAITSDLAANLVLKPECFQVTGSFKPRGAFNAVLRLAAAEPPPAGVIAVSSGNHAQAVALAARTAGLPAVILIPEDANPAKVTATRALGAEVITEGITFANRERRVREVMAERGLALVHPFDDWDVIHGQATAAAELLDDRPELEVIAAPVGGGGLLAGTALAARARSLDGGDRAGRSVSVIGVEPALADDARRSFVEGRIHVLAESPATIADGVRTVSVGERTFDVIAGHHLVDDIVTVSEDEIAAAVVTAWTRLKLALEPTGALALAGYLAGKLPARGRVGVILTGGNFAPALIARLLSGA
jgi:threonine dehydratase